MSTTQPPGSAHAHDELPSSTVTLIVNDQPRSARCPDRTLLVELIRDELGLFGTHAGCLNGDCGACTVNVDGRITKSCLVLAPAAEGTTITTVEGLGEPGALHPVQEAFWEKDGFQCGFCLPGQLFATIDLLDHEDAPSDDDIRGALAGNICRCTGYQKIIDSVRCAAERTARTPD
ncbi:MAG: 4-hydroxybenzoyl-CoA reductase subunit gamma [Marmoricola sp.]|jgi:aerobic-type carbon monoxide dehydrogenase small subunit (CoxS/CutS family)|nr:4-hydroxybenzoyl-CoA reductase subunit gamma [Marmoricola sp.]